jgi:hypothetical protein
MPRGPVQVIQTAANSGNKQLLTLELSIRVAVFWKVNLHWRFALWDWRGWWPRINNYSPRFDDAPKRKV